MRKPLVLLATTVSAVALAGAVGVGVATADPTPSPSATPTVHSTPAAGKSTKAKTAKHRALASRALHCEVTLAGKKHRVVDFQRGTVSAVTTSSLTVRSADGFVGTYVVGPKTHVRVAEKQSSIGDVATGDRVRVVGTKDGKTVTASRVMDRQK